MTHMPDMPPTGIAPPRCPESERAIIAAMLDEPTCIPSVFARIGPDDLHEAPSRALARAIKSMYDAGEAITPTAVGAALRASGDAADVTAGAAADLAETLRDLRLDASAHDPMLFVDDVVDCMLRREAIRRVGPSVARMYERSIPLADTVGSILPTLRAVESVGADAGPFATISSEDFEAGDYSVSWHVPGLLVRGQFGVLAGPAKACKTSIAVDLAVSIATGTRFLGHFAPGRPARVAMFSSESGHASLRDIARRVCIARDLRLADVDIE